MMRFISALPLVAAAIGPTFNELTRDYSFEQFQTDFGKTYASDTELKHRRQIFTTALDEAVAHNGNKSHTWFKSINQFSDLTPDEFKNSHGWLPSWAAHDTMTAEPFPTIPADFDVEGLPASVDWRKKGVVTPIKNQGGCGSCWAFSTTENIESHVALNTTKLVELSPQNLVSCDPNPKHCGGTGGCLGSIPELGFDYVSQNGIASEAAWPYTSGSTSADGACKNISATATVGGYVKLPENNYTAVMWALANVGPLAINVDAIPMQSYGGGLFMGCAVDKSHIDHVIQLVGYGVDHDLNQKYWIVRNSWGATWGEAGYMKLLRHDPSEQWCSLDISPSDGTGCTGGPGTVKVCGSCGILYDVSYPTGATLL